MLRTLIAFLHIISFSFIFSTDVNELKKEEFKAEINTPGSIDKASGGIVEIVFTVGSVKGFAKLTDNLPAGVIAEAVDMGNATFTFNNGVLKIIWLNFPTDKTFSVKYKLKVADSAPNSFELGGKFSYLENNEKRSYSVFKKSIATGEQALADQTTTEQKAEKVQSYAKVVRTVESLGNEKYQVKLNITKQGIEGFCKIQEFTSFGAKMTEGNLSGAIFSFIKNKGKFVWMALPPEENFTVSYNLDLSAAKDKDVSILRGDFSFLEGNVTKKVDIINEGEEVLAAKTEVTPKENESTEKVDAIKKEPKEIAPTNTDLTNQDTEAITTPALDNEIALVTKDEEANTVVPTNSDNEKREIAESSEEELLSDNTNTTEEISEEISEENTPLEEEEEEEEEEVIEETPILEETPVLENLEVEKEKENTNEENKDSKTETAPLNTEQNKEQKTEPVLDNDFGVKSGVNYRVQIAAGKNVVNKAYFEKRHNWTNDFVIENHSGWVKYTTGSYQVYRNARDNRETVNAGNHKFDGPFVTAYNEGIRITVQEALMISKQKWFK